MGKKIANTPRYHHDDQVGPAFLTNALYDGPFEIGVSRFFLEEKIRWDHMTSKLLGMSQGEDLARSWHNSDFGTKLPHPRHTVNIWYFHLLLTNDHFCICPLLFVRCVLTVGTQEG